MTLFKVGPNPSTSSAPATTPLAAIAQLAPAHLVGSMAIFQRIYVGSIQFDISESDLERLFGQFGPVRRVDMMQDPVNRRHRGYGFIEFETAEAAALAQEQMDCAELGGRSIKVGRPNNFPADLPPGVPRPLSTRLYIANIHELVQEEELRMVCEAFGPVKFCHLAPDSSTGGHRGYGFVEFERESSAINAIASLNNFELARRLLKVGKTITGGLMPLGMESIKSKQPPLSMSQSTKAKVPTAVLRAAQEINATLTPATNGKESTVMVLRNLEDYVNMLEINAVPELEADVADECAKFGTVKTCKVYLDASKQTVTIFVKFDSTATLSEALKLMHLRWFGGRQIIAEAYDEDRFVRGIYS